MLRSLFSLVLLAVLAGQPARAGEADARRLADQASAVHAEGDPLGASVLYEAAAEERSPLVEEYRLLAAETAVKAGDRERAEQMLERLRVRRLDPAQEARVQLVRARSALLAGDAAAALAALPQGDGAVTALMADVQALRAQALFGTGDPVSATAVLVRREAQLLGSEALIAENRDRLWSGLTAQPLDEADLRRLPALDPVTRGWVALAAVLQQPSGTALLDWQAQYPAHPARGRLNSLRRQTTVSTERGVQPGTGGWAVLLPLSGPLASSGEAVRDGLLSGYFGSPVPRPSLRFYDSGSTGAEGLAAYRQALSDGASLVIGPLSKPGLTAILGAGTLPVPLLALNQVEGGVAGQVTQIALAPEDEAAAAAAQAAHSGLTRALLLVPASDWGERVAAAFSSRLTALGGQVLEVQRYAPGSADLSGPIRNLLDLSDSEARLRALSAVLGTQPEFEPRRRQDADLLFLGATAGDARIILPQLSFHRAGALPVYATSLVYGGAAGADRVRFCDMPWMLDRHGRWADARALAEAQYDSARRQPRLFAFGVDAWALAGRMQQGGLWQGGSVDGATGALEMQGDGRMQRGLTCAQAIDGGLLPLP